LLIRLLLQLLFNFPQGLHLLPELAQFLLQVRRLRLKVSRLRPIGGIEGIQIALDAFVNLLHPLFELVRREVLIAVVDRLELAAIDRHDGLAEQVELAAQGHKPPAHIADAFAVIVAEIGDSLEVRR
jgi:hypothetical protein